MPQSANIHEHLSKLCSAMLFVCQKRDKVENEGYVDNVKTLLSKYGLARISLSAFYNWLWQLGFKYCTQKNAALWIGMRSLPQ